MTDFKAITLFAVLLAMGFGALIHVLANSL